MNQIELECDWTQTELANPPPRKKKKMTAPLTYTTTIICTTVNPYPLHVINRFKGFKASVIYSLQRLFDIN